MTHTKLFFSILQQRHEGMFAPLSQLAAGDTNIESVLPEHGIPSGADTAQASSGETNLE